MPSTDPVEAPPCSTAGHETTASAGVVVLTNCNEASCAGHPYCTPCIDTLLTDPYNTLVEDHRPTTVEVPDIFYVEEATVPGALRVLAARFENDSNLVLVGLWDVEPTEPWLTRLQVVVTRMEEPPDAD